MEILALIPARGGSKGIKRKNLVPLKNKPLVAHSIEHALSSKLVTRTIVSTEDDEIKKVALSHKAEVPFLRPKELAEDHVLDLPVFEHALTYLKDQEQYAPDIVVHLRPTTPFRQPNWIDEAITKLIENKQADSIRSVSKPTEHPYRMFRLNKEGFLNPLMAQEHPHPYLLRRQDLPDLYYYNCVIDVTRPKTIFEKKSMTGDKILPFIMNADDVIDIDSAQNLEFARFIMERQQ